MARRKLPGLVEGLGVTFRTMMRGAVTVQYPHEREDPAPRARGVIALKEENCTVCMLCARKCPDWCIYIEGHKEQRPPRREGGRVRSVSVLDRFDIDYALCMYCGICVEVCPFDALFWSPEYEYAEVRIADLLHDKAKLGEWMLTVPEQEALEVGAELPSKAKPKGRAAAGARAAGAKPGGARAAGARAAGAPAGAARSRPAAPGAEADGGGEAEAEGDG